MQIVKFIKKQKMEAEKKEEHIDIKEHHHKSTIKKYSLWNFFIVLTILLGIILIVNIIVTYNLSNQLKKSEVTLQEKSNPAKIQLNVIKNSKCSDCFDILTITNHLKNSKVNVTKENVLEFDSPEGKELIDKYKIEKIPTFVVTGEIDKVNIAGLEKKGDALLFTKLEPPYMNVTSGKVEGMVTLYLLKDMNCVECNNLTSLVTQIKLAGIKIDSDKNIDINTDGGNELVRRYNIGFVPTIILSKEAGVYQIIQQAWSRVGSKETDGSYVLRVVYPPFLNLTTNKLRGLVNIVYLSDKNCLGCYDVNLHKEILTNPQTFNFKIDKEETIYIDDARGKELISKYNITQVPTIILSNEISAYPSTQALKQFFTAEKDGNYVFRRAQSVGTYKDLTTNQIVKAEQQTQQKTS